MSIIFEEGTKRLVFSITGYQFPFETVTNEYDANWLMVQVDYSDAGVENTYIEPCLLSFELESLVNEIRGIIQGKETGMITDFLEPNLKLLITKVGELYAVQIRFVYEMSCSGWKEVYVCQGLDKHGLQDLYNSFKALSTEYPVRGEKNKMV